MSAPTVSVIIPTHNRADILPRAIKSVLAQTYPDFECIVVDDASTDSTSEVVHQFSDERLVYLRHEKNRHVSAARNTGIPNSKGDFIAFLDDDDEWLPTKLEKQVQLLIDEPQKVGMVYCWLDYCEREQVKYKYRPQLRGNIFEFVLDQQRIGNSSTLLVRRSVVKTVGGFDESLPRGNDGDFIRRVCREFEVDYVPEMLVKVHIGHRHQRITQDSENGIRNALKGNLVKLAKFKEQLPNYPKQTASIYATIAYHYSQLGDWKNSATYISLALKTYPYSLSVYSHTLRCIKNLVFRRSV